MKQIVLTHRQVAALIVAFLVAAFLSIGGSWFLTRQPTDELRSRDGRIQRLTTGLGDCMTDDACKRAFHRLDRASH